MKRAVNALLVGMWLIGLGCGALADLDSVKPGEEDSGGDSTDTRSDGDTDTGADTDTDTDTDRDTDTCTGEACLDPTDSDSDSDTVTDADAGTDTDTDTDTDGDTDTCTGEACLDPTDSDSGTITDTDADTDTDTDTDVDTDTCRGEACLTPTDTDSASEADTCAPAPTCADLGWECGGGDDGCGNEPTCPACGEGNWCDGHDCAPCDEDNRCGESCEDCTADPTRPVCVDGEACGCASETPDICGQETYCDTTEVPSGKCEPCTVADSCGPFCLSCIGETPECRPGETVADAECVCTEDSCGEGSYCAPEGTCATCDGADHCGPECVACGESQPFCDPEREGGTCVECLEDADCREGEVAPFNSPLGICTPDKTCTCFVESATGTCTSTSCPTGFVCAQDLSGENHFACLRPCAEAASPVAGISCGERNTTTTPALVWAPMTTCYAFDKFGVDCSGNVGLCSVDGTGGLSDGTCIEASCTYSCWDGESGEDTWCADSSSCGTIPPYSLLCEVP